MDAGALARAVLNLFYQCCCTIPLWLVSPTEGHSDDECSTPRSGAEREEEGPQLTPQSALQIANLRPTIVVEEPCDRQFVPGSAGGPSARRGGHLIT